MMKILNTLQLHKETIKVLGKRKGKYEWIHEDIQEWVDGVEDIELNGW